MERRLTAFVVLLLGLLVPVAALAQQRPSSSSSRRPAARRISLSSYRTINQRWHNATTIPAARFTSDGRFVLRLSSLNGLGSTELTPERQDGGFDETQRAEVARVLGDRRNGRHAPIDRRLIDVIFEIARHFEVGQVNIVSGFRSEAGRSNHAIGRAADIVLPGVRDEQVAEFARTIGFLGVGVYPHSGFVHVDVRNRSFFWVDASPPGRTTRRRSSRRRRSRGLQEVHGTQAQEADARARARGVTPIGGVDAAPAMTPDGSDDSDDDEEQPPAPGVTPSGG